MKSNSDIYKSLVSEQCWKYYVDKNHKKCKKLLNNSQLKKIQEYENYRIDKIKSHPFGGTNYCYYLVCENKHQNGDDFNYSLKLAIIHQNRNIILELLADIPKNTAVDFDGAIEKSYEYGMPEIADIIRRKQQMYLIL